MTSVGELQVADITPVWYLLITELRLEKSINHNVMLWQQFLPTRCQILSDFFIFYQDSAPEHKHLRQSTIPP